MERKRDDMKQRHRDHMKHTLKKTERVYTDPVCGMQISYKTAPAMLKYNGKTYCFCAEVCQESFEKNPDLYLMGHKK